jgi:cell division protein ZapA (FtsZ GTPase activity inhibitor)
MEKKLGLKIDKSVSVGAILQSVVVAIAALLVISEFNETQENNILIAQRVVNSLDDLDTYLSSIDDSSEDIDRTLNTLEDHLEEIKESVGEMGYGDESLVDTINEIKRDID